jgi:hypothetical protein
MKLKSDVLITNRTRRYLAPCLSLAFGESFRERMNGLFKLGLGIGDVSCPEDLKDEKAIYILIDKNYAQSTFGPSISWLRMQEYFICDYQYGSSLNYHMIVVRLPEVFHNAFDNFKNSRYSSMYNSEELAIFELNGLISERDLKILRRDGEELIFFVDYINEEFNTDIKAYEFEGEIDMPINIEDESF